MENEDSQNQSLTATEEEREKAKKLIPSAEEMLERLYQVDTEPFDPKTVTLELMGSKAWIFVSMLPISAILLGFLTFIGTYASGHFVISFIISAMLVYVFGKIMESYERQYRQRAFAEVMRRIAETEGEFGLLPHFKDFLPKKYLHLIQSLKKGNYIYIKQYVQAITLLQQKLDPDKFTRIWYLKYPDIAPETEQDDEESFE